MPGGRVKRAVGSKRGGSSKKKSSKRRKKNIRGVVVGAKGWARLTGAAQGA